MKLPELLAPAGNFAALEAAIEGGADAVYFGASQFNARMRAGNFAGEELSAAIKLCRAHGVKSYVTMNIRIYDRELEDALRLASELYAMGADALIVADHGLAAEIKKQIPGLEIHASTQMSGHTAEDARALMEAGFTRMVCPREISREGLHRLCEESPIEIEMFCHGAYCVSFSGQCLMSAVMGGRSGNRGSCAQPCRQPYTQKGEKGYPISLKDMCLASHIEDIIRSGVASLKLEGRQKPAEYVYGVTKIYRRLLDEGRNATDAELSELANLFSRQGFSAGYYKNSARSMIGVRTIEEYRESTKTVFEGLRKKVPVETKICARIGEKLAYSISTPGKSVTVYGDAVEMREDASPMTAEVAEKNAARLGNTPFELAKCEYEGDAGAFVTGSMLNRLRRDAVEKLTTLERGNAPSVLYRAERTEKKGGDVKFTAEFAYGAQITERAREFFSRIYLPEGREGADVSLRPIRFDTGLPESDRVLVHTTGQLYEAEKAGLSADASFRLNVFNSATAKKLCEMGAESVTLSPELTVPQMRDISVPCEKRVIVYGRLPLMTMFRCAISDGGKNCKCGGSGFAGGGNNSTCKSSIKDRKGVEFPILALPDCTNIIYNSVPVFMADKKSELYKTGADAWHFIFSNESPEEVDRIIECYEKGLAHGGQVTRLG